MYIYSFRSYFLLTVVPNFTLGYETCLEIIFNTNILFLSINYSKSEKKISNMYKMGILIFKLLCRVYSHIEE